MGIALSRKSGGFPQPGLTLALAASRPELAFTKEDLLSVEIPSLLLQKESNPSKYTLLALLIEEDLHGWAQLGPPPA